MQENSIDTSIRENYDKLGPQERRAADVILDRLDDFAIYSSAEIAELAGVSRPTVSRLYRRLGFASFAEVRNRARSLRGRGVPVYSEGTDGPSGIAAAQEHLRSLNRTVATPEYTALVEALATAPSVHLIGFRNSYPVAMHLRNQLAQTRNRVDLLPLPGQSLGDRLPFLGPDALVLFIGFRRRPARFERYLDFCVEHELRVALIGDPSARAAGARAGTFLECPIDSPGAFDDYAAPMTLVSLLAHDVLRASGQDGQEHVSLATDAYEVLSELEM